MGLVGVPAAMVRLFIYLVHLNPYRFITHNRIKLLQGISNYNHTVNFSTSQITPMQSSRHDDQFEYLQTINTLVLP